MLKKYKSSSGETPVNKPLWDKTQLIRLNDETGHFYTSETKGKRGKVAYYLWFSGDSSFIRRTKNLIINYGLMENKTNFTFIGDSCFITLAGDIEFLAGKLLDYFENESILCKDENCGFEVLEHQPLYQVDENGEDVQVGLNLDVQLTNLDAVSNRAYYLLEQFFLNKITHDEHDILMEKFTVEEPEGYNDSKSNGSHEDNSDDENVESAQNSAPKSA